MCDEKVTITVDEYKRLLQLERKLTYLENFGVDNWCGYDDAIAAFHEDEEND